MKRIKSSCDQNKPSNGAMEPTETAKAGPIRKMKPGIFCLLSIAVVGGILAGCASRSYEKAARTASALTKSASLITQGSILIDDSLASLNDLVTNPQPDLRKQFKTFNSAVDKLGATAADVADEAHEMKVQGAGYFAQWDKDAATIQNEDLRNRSEARKNEVAARFARISRQYDETKSAFQSLMSDLRDVQKFLANDLTTGGLAAIQDGAAKAKQDAAPLRMSLAALSEEFTGLGLSMSSTTAEK